MFESLLTSISSNYGLLGILFVLALLVIWWQQRRYDALLAKYEAKSQHMYDQVISFKDTFYAALTDQTDTNRMMAEKMASMAESLKTIASGMYTQMYPRKEVP